MERRTIANTTADETGDSEATVEDTVGGVGEHDVAKTSSTQVGDRTEHADCRETVCTCQSTRDA